MGKAKTWDYSINGGEMGDRCPVTDVSPATASLDTKNMIISFFNMLISKIMVSFPALDNF